MADEDCQHAGKLVPDFDEKQYECVVCGATFSFRYKKFAPNGAVRKVE